MEMPIFPPEPVLTISTPMNESSSSFTDSEIEGAKNKKPAQVVNEIIDKKEFEGTTFSFFLNSKNKLIVKTIFAIHILITITVLIITLNLLPKFYNQQNRLIMQENAFIDFKVKVNNEITSLKTNLQNKENEIFELNKKLTNKISQNDLEISQIKIYIRQIQNYEGINSIKAKFS